MMSYGIFMLAVFVIGSIYELRDAGKWLSQPPYREEWEMYVRNKIRDRPFYEFKQKHIEWLEKQKRECYEYQMKKIRVDLGIDKL